MALFFTADLHFGHKNIIKYENRPFNDVDEMREAYIKEWNETVTNNDCVYILGDFSFLGKTKTKEILERLNGTKFIIFGNHDKVIEHNLGFFSDVLRFENSKVKLVDAEDFYWLFSHIPINDLCVNIKNKFIVNIHGHLHTNQHRDIILSEDIVYVNVGVDATKKVVVSLDFVADMVYTEMKLR